MDYNMNYNPSNFFAPAQLVLENIPQLKLGNIHCEKDLKDNKHNSLHLGGKMLRYLSLDIICSL